MANLDRQHQPGSEFSSLGTRVSRKEGVPRELWPRKVFLYLHSEQDGGHCLPPQVPTPSPFSLLPRCPTDSWALMTKSMLAAALGDDKACWMELQPEEPPQYNMVDGLSPRSQTQFCSSCSEGRPRNDSCKFTPDQRAGN